MPRITALIVMGYLLCTGPAIPIARGTGETRFDHYGGKYPSDLFKEEPEVTRRLRTLLGGNYDFFMERPQTQVPFRTFKGILFSMGCKAHECTIEDAILLIDLSDGTLHCAIRSDTYRGKLKKFSEDPSRFPSAALDYALDQ